MNQNKLVILDTDNNENTGKTQSNRETSSAQLSNEEGVPVEKKGRGRPRKPAQIIIGEMVEEDVFHTPIVQSAFSYSPKEVRKHKDKGKSKTNSISISEPTENNENNDSEKTKKSGREVFPCGVCEGNIGVNSKECGGCKKWTHFRCHAIYKGKG